MMGVMARLRAGHLSGLYTWSEVTQAASFGRALCSRLSRTREGGAAYKQAKCAADATESENGGQGDVDMLRSDDILGEKPDRSRPEADGDDAVDQGVEGDDLPPERVRRDLIETGEDGGGRPVREDRHGHESNEGQIRIRNQAGCKTEHQKSRRRRERE